MTILLLLFLFAVVGLVLIRSVVQPRQSCQTLAHLPKKEFECVPGSPGADRIGPQGPPGRDCYPALDSDGSWGCSLIIRPRSDEYTRQQHTMFEAYLYIFWALFVMYTVYTLAKQTGLTILVLVVSLSIVYLMYRVLM